MYQIEIFDTLKKCSSVNLSLQQFNPRSNPYQQSKISASWDKQQSLVKSIDMQLPTINGL